MIAIQEKYVTDEKGKRTAVLIDISEYERLCEYLEDLEDAAELIKARENGSDFLDFTQWKERLEAENRI